MRLFIVLLLIAGFAIGIGLILFDEPAPTPFGQGVFR